MPELPGYYAITAPLKGGEFTSGSILAQPWCRRWLERFERLLESDVEMVQLRVKDLSGRQLEGLARHCQRLAEARGVRLLLNGPPELAEKVGMAGVHLTSASLAGVMKRPLSAKFLVGASCHSPGELARAEAIGADFACLSPLHQTKGYGPDEVLGLERFAEWVSACSIPVYALGGASRQDLDAVRDAGGHGVAGISAFWPKEM